ncbi:MAG: phosphatase PAP2 family protein [Nocardioidaceae bacterium]
MDTLIVDVAQYAIFLVAIGAVAVWVAVGRSVKVRLAVEAVVTVAVVAILVKVTSGLHTDPRPFVADPSLRPMFPHPPDNGFPSDHTALASGVAFLVTAYRRWIGAALLAIAVAIGLARVAAHVHHLQDIGAGLLIGLVAAAVALLVWRLAAACWVRVRSRPGGPTRLHEPSG